MLVLGLPNTGCCSPRLYHFFSFGKCLILANLINLYALGSEMTLIKILILLSGGDTSIQFTTVYHLSSSCGSIMLLVSQTENITDSYKGCCITSYILPQFSCIHFMYCVRSGSTWAPLEL